MMTAWIVFGITCVIELVLGGSLLLTMFHEDFRVWPPPRRESWQYRFTWSLTILSGAGILLLGILDWASLSLSVRIRAGLGIPLITGGLLFSLWAVRVLSFHTSLGLGGPLVREGPYRYSRNPQYAGDVLILAGYGLLSASWMALVTGSMGMVWFLLAPYVEEPWLQERYGPAYAEYRKEVPRLLGFPSGNDAD